jgi:hypothetical protein
MFGFVLERIGTGFWFWLFKTFICGCFYIYVNFDFELFKESATATAVIGTLFNEFILLIFL